MKPEKMMDVLGEIDDALVEEFAQRRPPRFHVPWSLVTTAACLCLVIASLVFLRSMGLLPVAPMPTDPTQTTQTTAPLETTMPTETTTPTQPSQQVQEELDRYNALFGDKGTFYNLALASTYDSADKVGLLYFFYNGINGELEAASAEEEAQLKKLQRRDDVHTLYRMPESKMDEVLIQYFGLTVDQMNKKSSAFAGMEYLESTDCWYYYGGAILSVERFVARSVTANPDGTLAVYYSAGTDAVATKVVTLQPYGDGYRILSNQQIAQ